VKSILWNGEKRWSIGRLPPELRALEIDPEPTQRALQTLIDSDSARPFAFRFELDEHWSEVQVYWDKLFPGHD
jgi:hypothetical protein